MAFNANATNSSVVYSPQGSINQVVTADHSIASSTTLETVTGLTIPLGKYERIAFKYKIFYSTTANSDFKYLVDVPASITLYRCTKGGADHAGTALAAAPITAEGSAIAIAVSGTEGFLDISGVLENGAALGELKFTFAQNSSHADATLVRRGSNVEFYRF